MNTHEEIRTYAGRRQTTRGTLAYFYLKGDGTFAGHKKPLVPGAPIGTQIAVTFDDEGQFWIAGANAPRAIGHLDDPDTVQEWSLAEKADVTQVSIQRESKRVAKEGKDPLRAQLDPIRTQLARMSYDRRAATVAWILQYLLGGSAR